MFRKKTSLQFKPLLNQGIKKTNNNSTQLNGSINVTQLKNGESAKVIALQGGHHAIAKLEAMEIVPGTIIVKKSASLMKGPVVIKKGNMQLAIGYGLAQKIIVEPIQQNK